MYKEMKTKESWNCVMQFLVMQRKNICKTRVRKPEVYGDEDQEKLELTEAVLEDVGEKQLKD